MHVPQEIYDSLPAEYDLLEFVTGIFQGLENAQSSLFIEFVESGLSKSILIRSNPWNKLGRRLSIRQSHFMIALVIISFMSENRREPITSLIGRLYKALSNESDEWAAATTGSLSRILGGEVMIRKTTLYSTMVELGMRFDSISWYNIRIRLISFFESESNCSGFLGDRWKQRLAAARSTTVETR
jgi:hypothetical protein